MQNRKKITTALSLVTMMAIGIQAATLEERVQVLEEQNTALTEEVLATQSGGFTLVDTEKSYNGLGAAASKVYFSQNPLSIGGYGEMYYANPDNGDDFADVYRFITYFGYKFSDSVILNAEIEFEHGGNEVAIEFLYLDFLINKTFNVRAGNVLVPMGLVNQKHEPTLFNTVQRPEIEQKLIPSTWHENGVLAYGSFDSIGLNYTAGVINALNLNNAHTSTPDNNWIRKARLGSGEKASYSPAFVGRLDYTGVNGLLVGASMYYGDGSNLKDDPADISGTTMTMFDVHAKYDNGPFSAYGLYTQSSFDGAEKISANAAQKASGYYLNASYDVGDAFGIGYKLPLFAQYENYNPLESTVDGVNEDIFDTQTVTIGLNFFPVDQAVIKMDYAMKTVNNVDTNTFSVGFGFIF